MQTHILTRASGKSVHKLDAPVQDASSRVAMAREASLALDLAHPNVLSSFARVTNDEGEFVGMAMELLNGDDLLAALT